MSTLRVKARVHGPDSNGFPRSPGEIFDVEEARARVLARDGFIELIDDNGQGVPFDHKFAPPVVVVPAPRPKPKPKKKK